MGRPGCFVRGESLPGAVFWKWEPPVPFVRRPVLGCSIFLYNSEDDATQGTNWGGSGLLVGIPSQANPSRVHLYAVTNDHVAISCPVPRLVNRTGDAFVLPGGYDSDWTPHPDGDDIAIRPLGAVPEAEYWYVPAEFLLSEGDLSPDEFPDQISPGDDCLMVGRYINEDQRQFDRPVVRFGNLAMLPEFVHQSQRSFDQESFLVDMRSQSGFSGSPVFLYYEETGWRWLPPEPEEPPPPPESPPPREFPPLPESMSYEDKTKASNAWHEKNVQEIEERHAARMKELDAYRDALQQRVANRHPSGIMSKTWLLGIDWGHLPVSEDVFDAGHQKIGRMKVSSGLAGVVPAWKLTDLLNDEEGIRMARDKTEEELSKKDEGAAVLDTSKTDEFERFEDLTRRLVQVPKRDLGEKGKDSG
jgi:hypothetical protein